MDERTVDLGYYRSNYQTIENLFKDIPTEILQQFQIKEFKKGELLTKEGQYGDDLFIILFGSVKAMDTKPAGTTMTYYILTTGDVMGLAEIVKNQKIRIASMLAATDVIAAVLSKKDMVEIFASCSELAMRICARVIDKLRGATRLLAQCNSASIYRSTITYLHFCNQVAIRQRKKDCTEPVRIMDSRQDIADFLGADLRSINRAVECLKSEGLVTIIKGKIHIDNDQFSRLTKIKESPIETI